METVFISYTSGDEDIVREFFDVINRLYNIQPYVAEWMEAAGMRLDDKVTAGLNKSRIMIAIITHNSNNGAWMNQEIGYAFSRGMHIIPVKEQGVTITGMLEGKQWIDLDRYNLKQNDAQIINILRHSLRIGSFKLPCPHCNKVPIVQLPPHDQILNAISTQGMLQMPCIYCKKPVVFSPFDLSVATEDANYAAYGQARPVVW